MIARNHSARNQSASMDPSLHNLSQQPLDIPDYLPAEQRAVPLDRLSPPNNKVRWRSRKLPPPNEQMKEQRRSSNEAAQKDVHRWKDRKQRLKAKRDEKRKEIEECPVCSVQIQASQLLAFGACAHWFCSGCLSQQVRSCLQSLKLVRCLDEDCASVLQVTSPHIQSLSINQQQRYYKALVFANLANDPYLKLCPTEDCEGFINIKQEVVFCPICEIIFCQKCLMPAHPRECDENGVFFLQGNFHFRKCGHCQMVLEKNQGCNHMTCRCGYQFCYLCGGRWSSNHKCSSPPNGQIPLPALQRIPPPAPSAQQTIVIPPRPVPNHFIRPPQPQPDQALQMSVVGLEPPQQNPRSNVVQFSVGCACSFILHLLLRGLVIILTFFCLGQVVWTVFLLAVVPILACLSLICLSLGQAMNAMLQEYSCMQIVIGNIFLYLFCYGRSCINHIILYFRSEIWDCMWYARCLFPLTSKALALIEP